MPTLQRRLTDTAARNCPAPEAGYVVHWDPDQPGFGVRVTHEGVRAWVLERRVNGRTVRRTLGRIPGSSRNSISAEAARTLAVKISGELAHGVDRAVEEREARKVEKRTGLTFREALQMYIDDNAARKRPLKPRTRADYLGFIRPAQPGEDGRMRVEGELTPIADKRLDRLTGAAIKALYLALQKRGPTRAAYAMRVLRGTLNYHGVQLDDDPFSRHTPRRDRVVLPAVNKRDRRIPAEKLNAWWKACVSAPAGDFYQLLLLTGLRRGELTDLRIAEVDLEGGRLSIPDPKNSRPHVVLLSRQAAEIVARRVGERLPYEPLFENATDPRKSLRKIIRASGVVFSAHDCRRTFGSIAASLLPGYVTKKMLNHADGQDVTAAHYFNLDEPTLRSAWQVVADFITSQPAGEATMRKVVRIDGRRAA